MAAILITASPVCAERHRTECMARRSGPYAAWLWILFPQTVHMEMVLLLERVDYSAQNAGDKQEAPGV